MVTVYHMDGPDLIATHYCALGNQPRLKYQGGKDPKVLEFKSVSVGNSKSMNDMHMGYAKFTLVDDNHYTAEWHGMVNQKPDAGHEMKASLTRKSKYTPAESPFHSNRRRIGRFITRFSTVFPCAV